MTKKSNHKESFILSFAFIVSATLGISLVIESTLHFFNIYHRYLSLGLGLLALTVVFDFSTRVFSGLYLKSRYLILFSNLLLISIGILMLLEATKQ